MKKAKKIVKTINGVTELVLDFASGYVTGAIGGTVYRAMPTPFGKVMAIVGTMGISIAESYALQKTFEELNEFEFAIIDAIDEARKNEPEVLDDSTN